MRPFRFIFDLPWWTGLMIFLSGNISVTNNYLVGMPICLFGAWTFSKLLKYDDYTELGCALLGIPLFFLIMLIPDQFHFKTPYVDLLNQIPAKVNFSIRASLGMMVALIAFRGVRR